MATPRLAPPSSPGEGIALSSPQGRWVVAATVLGSGIAFLDSTVVNVALPHIGDDLDTGVGGLQWVLNGYLLAVSSLILLGGAPAAPHSPQGTPPPGGLVVAP